MAFITGSTAEAQERKGKANMVESSETLPKKERTSTKRTERLTPELALEIVEDSLKKYQSLGGEVTIVPEMYDHGRRYIAVLLADVQLIDGNMVRVPLTK